MSAGFRGKCDVLIIHETDMNADLNRKTALRFALKGLNLNIVELLLWCKMIGFNALFLLYLHRRLQSDSSYHPPQVQTSSFFIKLLQYAVLLFIPFSYTEIIHGKINN